MGPGTIIFFNFCLFDFTSLSTIWDFPGSNPYKVEPGRIKFLAQGHNTKYPRSLEPATPRFQVKHSTASCDYNNFPTSKHQPKNLDRRKPVFRGLQTTMAQNLHISTDLLAPLLFANWKVSYLNLLLVIFQFNS